MATADIVAQLSVFPLNPKAAERYRARINELFGRHPDRDLFTSLPGAGEKLAPRLLAEMGADRTTYDGERHLRDQVKHGSWVITLMPKAAAQSS